MILFALPVRYACLGIKLCPSAQEAGLALGMGQRLEFRAWRFRGLGLGAERTFRR